MLTKKSDETVCAEVKEPGEANKAKPSRKPRAKMKPGITDPIRPGLPRAVEAMLAFAVLVISSPILAVAAIAIKLTSRGPVFFRQERIGRNGRRFVLIKLRTMHSLQSGPQVTAGDDGRITAVGKLLRAAKIDEFPELWNVVRGDMSLVGPRPEVPGYVDLSSPLWERVVQARPGLTDPVTLRLRNEEALLSQASGDREAFYRDTVQPFKLQGYLEYLQQRTWWTDVKVLWTTAIGIVRSEKLPPPRLREVRAGWKTFHSGLLTRQVQFALDLIVLVGAFALAYALRFEFAIPHAQALDALIQLPYVVAIEVGCLLLAGVHRFIWRYIGMREIRPFLYAALLSAAVLGVLRLSLRGPFGAWRVPLSVIVMDTVLAFGGILGLRVLRRFLHEGQEKQQRAARGGNGKRSAALLVGAGQAGVLAAREILGRGDMDLDVKGFVDDDLMKQRALIHGIRVLGMTDDLPQLVKQHRIDQVVITIAQISRPDILRIISVCQSIPVKVRIIPGLYEILQGKVHVTRIRNVRVEDLLGREPVSLEEQQLTQFLAGKTVMVTGAGGSIGSELARQVARFRPSNLLLVERAEFALFEIDAELRGAWPDLSIVPLVADVGDEVRIRSVFSSYRPQVILHAAAHKHVPMMESNPAEAIKNNVLATRLVGEVAGQSGAEAFVLISTDKAVRPTSVMGASKRVAELVVQDLARRFPTRFLAVRFGNVIGSNGSVIPIFREQIRRGGPVTVTHPEMTRYFMTIREAAQLVLQTGAMGERGEIFILDMGKPVRILDLAVEMIRLTGLKPFEEMDIVFTGLRPGEKLFEELELSGEKIASTRHPRIFIGKIAGYSVEELERGLRTLAELARDGHGDAIRSLLNELLPEAKLARVHEKDAARSPEGTGATLDASRAAAGTVIPVTLRPATLAPPGLEGRAPEHPLRPTP